MKNFESLIEKAKQEKQEIKASHINDILNISYDQYLQYSDSIKAEISDILTEYFVDMLPLMEKLALNNYIGLHHVRIRNFSPLMKKHILKSTVKHGFY